MQQRSEGGEGILKKVVGGDSSDMNTPLVRELEWNAKLLHLVGGLNICGNQGARVGFYPNWKYSGK